ncbi:MAG: hypothetical protein HQK83_09360 [Fibrobacteria bacterium]|nr:hypothetical protein [Fibrobacteria bacterium]
MFAVAVNLLLFPEYPGFHGVTPHPYWIPILVFSLRYSIAVSMISAFSFSILFSVLFYMSPVCLDLEHLFEFDNILLAFSFPMVALVLSISTNKQNQVVKYLKQRGAKLQGQIEPLQKAVQFQEELNKKLESKIINNTNTISKVFEISKTMESRDIGEIFSGLLEAMAFHLNVLKATVYSVDGEQLHLEAAYGYEGDEQAPENLEIAGLVSRCLSQKRIVWEGNREPNEESTPQGPVCCGPVLLSDHSTYAVVCVDDIPFISFNLETISFFGVLSEWTSRAVNRAVEMTRKQEKEIYDTEEEIYKFSYIEKLYQAELENFKRYQRPFSLVLLNFGCVPFMNRKNTQSIVHCLLNSCLRGSDVIARHRKDCAFLIFTPNTDKENVEFFAERCKNIINNFYNNSGEILITLLSATATIEDPEMQLGKVLEGIEHVVSS